MRITYLQAMKVDLEVRDPEMPEDHPILLDWLHLLFSSFAAV